MKWKHFFFDEFRCKHCGVNLMQVDFIDKLDALRDLFGRPLPVMSGYRCPAHNDAVSTTGLNGPHTTGRAVDFSVERVSAVMLMSLAVSGGRFTGFGFKQHGAGRFIHLDDLDGDKRPTVWTYP